MSESVVAPLKIGLSARLMHDPPAELGFRNKTLQYLEQAIAHWIMGHGAMVLMLPTLGFDAEVERRRVSVRHYVDALDGLVMQGGADVSPTSYGQQPLRPEWGGDIKRDHYEMELLEGFLAQGKPVLGICRGCQLINVAYGGSLYQDIATQRLDAHNHVDAELYDQHHHRVVFEPGSRLGRLYEGLDGGLVTSIHHQAVDRLGGDLQVEARSSEDGLVEAIRARGSGFVAGVQWHPEFHAINPQLLSGEPLMDGFLHWARLARDGG
ncbi:gamma-glutamyl-gamma-aminobutyrate hydrolase family protein [Roseateles violae]|uniref:Type 1 glutamine amidotransferase n=1 Tax=Roseateles violae TaxID=3058042 RepID=A0ABT8DPE8_9BURK|nr:type 1 glutamine amidotransferase [Pelomonas sp. PFR6]MDN3920214.1 type 1 glutamine amidotransferase [Pelomonas sp. PFR6]